METMDAAWEGIVAVLQLGGVLVLVILALAVFFKVLLPYFIDWYAGKLFSIYEKWMDRDNKKGV